MAHAVENDIKTEGNNSAILKLTIHSVSFS